MAVLLDFKFLAELLQRRWRSSQDSSSAVLKLVNDQLQAPSVPQIIRDISFCACQGQAMESLVHQSGLKWQGNSGTWIVLADMTGDLPSFILVDPSSRTIRLVTVPRMDLRNFGTLGVILSPYEPGAQGNIELELDAEKLAWIDYHLYRLKWRSGALSSAT
ncbi:unnamed protein product [Discula destructiva]